MQINSNVKQRKKINCLKIAKSFLNKTSNKFWPAVKKIRGTTKTIASVIDHKSINGDIVELFKNKYEDVYNSVPYDKSELRNLLCEIEKAIVKNVILHVMIMNICIILTVP